MQWNALRNFGKIGRGFLAKPARVQVSTKCAQFPAQVHEFFVVSVIKLLSRGDFHAEERRNWKRLKSVS
jgi:hypothetical protein